MATDPELARECYDRIAHLDGLSERKMFGVLCFMQYGNMICGVVRDGLMIRVGKPNMQAALALSDVEQMEMNNRPMSGFVATSYDTSHEVLDSLFNLARDFVRSLPPK